MPETIQAKSVKEVVLEMIQRLPDNCSLEDIQRTLAFRAAVERGIADIEAGRVFPHDDVKRMVAEWLRPENLDDIA
jgi:predicted transcriptional regulator